MYVSERETVRKSKCVCDDGMKMATVEGVCLRFFICYAFRDFGKQ